MSGGWEVATLADYESARQLLGRAISRAARKAGAWERIARRRAEIIARQQRLIVNYRDTLAETVRHLNWANDSAHTLSKTVSARDAEIIRLDNVNKSLSATLIERNDTIADLQEQLKQVSFERGVAEQALEKAQGGGDLVPDDSGREYPQAWQSTRPAGTIYREAGGEVEYWVRSVYSSGPAEWRACGPTFRTLTDVRAFYRRHGRELVKVPSPDCKNCQGTGAVQCGIVESIVCPVCCGGS